MPPTSGAAGRLARRWRDRGDAGTLNKPAAREFHPLMKKFPLRFALLAAFLPLASCMTTYDSYGRPVQTVDPGAAAVGVLAAGAIGYAIGQNNEPRYVRGYYGGGYCGPGYGGGYYGGGYYPVPCH